MLRNILFMILLLASTTAVWAEGKYSLKTMTPEVQQALEGRRNRYEELRSLKSSGSIGENNHGYVEVLGGDGKAQSIASEENRDRQIIYKTIAQQNDLESAITTIEAAFAEVQKEKAEKGDKFQGTNGSWTTK